MESGLAPSRARARALILGGRVLVDGRRADKAGEAVAPGSRVEVQGGPEYVGRGGEKLAGALDAFGLSVAGLVVLDVGASTGGFTDCLLQRGAARVYALDVGYGQLAWKLQQDPRVVRLDRVNIRKADRRIVPEECDLATVDTAFISLRLVLPPTCMFLRNGGEIVALVKPQFEAGRGKVGRGGVVRDASLQREVLLATVDFAAGEGLAVRNWAESCLRGADGNREFFLHLSRGGEGDRKEQIEKEIGRWRPPGP